MTNDIARKMRWHAKGCTEDGRFRQPVDGKNQKCLGRINLAFGRIKMSDFVLLVVVLLKTNEFNLVHLAFRALYFAMLDMHKANIHSIGSGDIEKVCSKKWH